MFTAKTALRLSLALLVVLATVLVSGTAAQGQAGNRFVDDDGNIHEGFIEAIADAGITQGCTADRYCPLGFVTRAQMSSFLQRALSLPPGGDAFVDDEGNVHEEAINAVAAAGIAEGCDEGRFCPEEPVTRAQMAAFIVAGFDLIPSFVNFFRDDDESIHEPDINATSRDAVTIGCNGTYLDYCPSHPVLRGQMATLLARAHGLSSHAPPQRQVAYQVNSLGEVAGDLATFREVVTDTLRDPRGWALNGAVEFVPVAESSELRVWLASPAAVDQASPGCSQEYSCRVGADVYINDQRWREGSQTFEDRELGAYQAYVVNHEVGHWVGLDHRECPYQGASAPVMLQQTISLDGCESRVWPLPEEHDAARRSLGL